MVMSTGPDCGKDALVRKKSSAASCDPSGGDDFLAGFSIRRAPVARHLQERKLRRSLERKLWADGYVAEEEPHQQQSDDIARDVERREMDVGAAQWYSSSRGQHQRAAVEFVMELAGKHTVPVSDKIAGCHSLLHADEIPVPMFSIDFDMRCVLWNKRAADMTGWSEAEIFAKPKFQDAIFSSPASPRRELGEEVLRGAFGGQRSAEQVWNLATKWGQELKVHVVASPRTDANGVAGAICVIMPAAAPALAEQPPGIQVHCQAKSMDEDARLLDLEDDQLSEDGVDQFLSALDSPLSERGATSMEIFAAQRSIFAEQAGAQSEGEGTSVCSQDWCKSEGSQSVGGAGGLEPSGGARARVMVVDPRPRGRKSLTLLLERCGFDVACACSAAEALWRFEQSLHDPDAFAMLFVSLPLARADGYDLVRELRSMEAEVASPVVIVAVTDLDRWDVSNADGLKKRDMAAGVDDVIACPSRVQQLRDTLATLGAPLDHLDFHHGSSKSPRAVFSSWNNTPILAR